MGGLRTSWLWVVPVVTSSFACSFQLPPQHEGYVFEDAPAADAYIPDASACLTTGPTCAGPVLRTCLSTGQLPVDTMCNWGCRSAPDAPHCGRLQPSGGALTLADLDDNAMLMDRTATSNNGVINTDDGTISVIRTGGGMGVVNGIDFSVRTLPGGRKVGVFRVRKLTLDGNWMVRGTNALAIVAVTDITIRGRLDMRGDCTGTGAGPGGFPGGPSSIAAAASTGGGAAGALTGQGPGSSSSGGGGGAYGDVGGDGGRNGGTGRAAGGARFGDDTITMLVGGGGGGGGGGAGGIGGGGGAVQLAANGTVKVELNLAVDPNNGINAGGCGGGGGGNGGGGGGGAGGTILIEAKSFVLDRALIAVNGGGGGAGNSTAGGDPGDWSNATARGGTGGQGTAAGGRGGAAGNRPGGRGTDAKESGGGGGGVGRIRINTLDAQGIQLANPVIISPSLGESNTTSTKGAANVQ